MLTETQWIYVWIALFTLVQIADVFTTIRALRAGLSEGNPVIAFFMKHLGKYGWVIAKLAMAAVSTALCVFFRLWPVLAILTIVTGVVACRNLILVRKG